MVYTFLSVIKKDKGYTLIELLATIALLGILLSIAVPVARRSYENWTFQAMAEMMVQDIREAQNLSITTGDDHQFQLNVQSKYYLIKHYDNRIPTLKRVELDSYLASITSNLYKPSSYYYVLSYNCMGVPNQPGSIYLTSKSGKKVRITIEFVTGRVRLYEE